MNKWFRNNCLFHWSLRIIYMWRGVCLQGSYCSHEQTTAEGTCPFVCHANCYHTNNYANCRTDGWDRMRKDAYWWRGIDSNTLKLQLLRMERPKHTLLDWNSWEILIKLSRTDGVPNLDWTEATNEFWLRCKLFTSFKPAFILTPSAGVADWMGTSLITY